MKRPFLVLIFMIQTIVFADTGLMSEIRLLYQHAATEKIVCEKLVSNLQLYTEHNNPTMAGYKACGMMMMANHKRNPFEKLSAFTEGKTLLEKCLQRESNNPELRFLRLSVQCNAPSFLQYNKSLEEDKQFLLRSVKSMKDAQLRQLILSFLLQSQEVTPAEKYLLTS